MFEFDDEPIETDEAHVLVPMKMCSKTYFGLVFVDCNDCSVYKMRDRFRFITGTNRERELVQSDLTKIDSLHNLLNDEVIFLKTC